MSEKLALWIAERASFCPLCRKTRAELVRDGTAVRIKCDRCGQVRITLEAFHDIIDGTAPDEAKACAASSFLRENPGIVLTFERWRELLEVKPPSVGERAEKLLNALAVRSRSLGSKVEVPFNGDVSLGLQASSWSTNQLELHYLLDDYLTNTKGWAKRWSPATVARNPEYAVTPAGHDFLASQRRTNSESSQGFCAMSFGDKFHRVWSEAIRPGIGDAGYKPMRLDEHAHSNRIDDEIIVQIRRSKFVVSDFTGQSGGIYFEAGFALGLGLPVIWTVRKDQLEKVHFDNRQYNFIVWNDDDLPAFRKALSDRIVAILGQGSSTQS